MTARFENLTLYRRLWQQVWPYWRYLAGILLLSLLAPPLALLVPLPLKIALDNIIGRRPLSGVLAALLPESVKQSDTALLLFLVALLVAVALLSQAREFASTLLTTYAGEKLLRGFRAQLFRQVQRLSLSYHDTKGTADSSYRIQYDAASIQRIAVDGVLPSFTSVLTFGSMIVAIVLINWRLALVALTAGPAVFLATRAYRPRIRHQAREIRKLESSALSVVHEVLGAARVVKAFGQEHREEARFVGKSNEGMRARIRLAFIQRGFGFLIALITALGTAAFLYIGVCDIQAGTLTSGQLIYAWGLLSQLYAPLKTLGKKMGAMQTLLASAERAFALLDEAPDVVEKPNALPLGRARGAMVFRHVSFAYEKDRPALRDVSFEIQPATCLGIAGATGAGKTTLVNLLTRFYDPTTGQILLDGVDLRDYRLADLRNQFTMVLQEPVLFSTSIAENIAYARPGANETEIIAAAQAANAHEFIVGLPEGYTTLVGERGMRLSGGERQRISLARAFLKDAPVLILDEPTSSVDVKTETAIVEALERLMHGRTTFIIAHRLGTLKHCDRILRIEHGQVVGIEPATTVVDGEPRAFGGLAEAAKGGTAYV
ncbi:MAG: ABC transporter ATP-binding protein [Verrucomicrobia bacterium]|nr:MAG: ABC transporter ATP-binding protein [Verrucomicrobiota bacterium]